MRCEDLIRELASPTGDLSPVEMAGHLASCPSCAEWSRRAAHLDRIWEATRPPGPSEAALDVLWANASLALDAQTVPSTFRLEGLTHRRRTWAKTAFLAAQAAAILGAAVFLSRQGGDGPAKVAVAPPEQVKVEPVKVVAATPEKVKVEPARIAALMPLNVDVENDETVLVEIGDNAKGHRKKVFKEPTSDSSAIPDGNQRDVFNALESMASL